MGKEIHWELCKKFKFDHRNIGTTQAQHRIRPRKWNAQNSQRFGDTNGSSNLGQTSRLSDSKKKKKKNRTYWIVDFGVPADYKVQLKESETRGKYLDLARELKKLWNMKVTVISTVICAIATVTKWLVQGLEDLEIRQVETIQRTALLRSDRILRSVLETWGDLLSSRLKWKTIS